MKTATYEITTQKSIRQLFWDSHPEFSEFKWIKKPKDKRIPQYNGDIRFAFNNFVDTLRKDGRISAQLAYITTL